MEDFRISNYLARDVEHYGRERAEQGAEVSPDGGEGGSMGADHYDFQDEQRELAEEQVQTPDEPEDAEQDDDTTAIVIAELDRMRLLAGKKQDLPSVKELKGRSYYQADQTDPFSALERLKDEPSEDTKA